MGMTLDPQFTSGRPYMYVVYTYDAAIGGTAPRWNDNCTDPPGAERDGCVVSGRLSKILPDGSEQPLIRDEWCQQYPSHSLGDVKFGPDGALYVTAGDGASYTFADYGQDGSPRNPCGDPPAGVGGAITPPTAEGGSLRSQDLRTERGSDRPRRGGCSASTPNTGAPLPYQPGHGRPQRRIIAYGCATPSASRSGPARPTPTSATSAGWRGRSSTGSRTRPPRYATTAGRATRARDARVATRRPASTSATTSTAPAPSYRRCTRTTTTPRSRPRTAWSGPRRSRAWCSTTAPRSRRRTAARCSSPTTRAGASG